MKKIKILFKKFKLIISSIFIQTNTPKLSKFIKLKTNHQKSLKIQSQNYYKRGIQ